MYIVQLGNIVSVSLEILSRLGNIVSIISYIRWKSSIILSQYRTMHGHINYVSIYRGFIVSVSISYHHAHAWKYCLKVENIVSRKVENIVSRWKYCLKVVKMENILSQGGKYCLIKLQGGKYYLKDCKAENIVSGGKYCLKSWNCLTEAMYIVTVACMEILSSNV